MPHVNLFAEEVVSLDTFELNYDAVQAIINYMYSGVMDVTSCKLDDLKQVNPSENIYCSVNQ